MKTYLKTLTRMYKKHITRFASIIFMVLISVGFVSGIGTSTDKIKYSLNDYYKNQNVSDFIIKSTDDRGFSDDDIDGLKEKYGEKNVNAGLSLDVYLGEGDEEQLVRLYFLDLENWTVNVPDLLEGDKPTSSSKVYAERADNIIKGYSVGDKVELDLSSVIGFPLKYEVEVCGIVQSPLTFAMDGEPSYENGEDFEVPDTINGVNDLITLDNVLYVSCDLIPLLPKGDIYIASPERNLNSFSPEYKNFVEAEKKSITSDLTPADGEAKIRIITLYDNYSFVSLNSYADKVMGIGVILMVAFLFVTSLVVLSNMTRLMEEERGQIACLRTLGYSSAKIVFKYLLFAMLATGIGGVAAYFVGLGLAYLLYFVFNFSFAMPPASSTVALLFYLLTYFVIVISTLAATVIAGFKMTRETPANLLRPKPPKAGKKVILEKIPLLWNRLSFKYKSTTRNVLRYMNRFVMTVVAVAVSTSLVMAGLAVLDLCLFGNLNAPSIMAISLVIILFAGLLTMVVIYTLTNINVSERNRELATLMVLGYYSGEVAGYIYREIYIDTAVGIVFGYPLSAFLIWLVFGVVDMGTVGGVSWFWWLVAPVVVLAFTFLVTLLLRRKIVKINMNESLKAIE